MLCAFMKCWESAGWAEPFKKYPCLSELALTTEIEQNALAQHIIRDQIPPIPRGEWVPNKRTVVVSEVS